MLHTTTHSLGPRMGTRLHHTLLVNSNPCSELPATTTHTYSESMHVCTHLVRWPQCHDCYYQQCCLHCKCMSLPHSLPESQVQVLSATLWWWYEGPREREGSCWRARWRQEVGHFHSHRRVWGCFPGGYVGGRGLWWQQEHLCACVYSNMVAVFNTTSSHKQ